MIPDFLRIENAEPADKTTVEYLRLLKLYREKIGDEIITEPSTWSDEEWIQILTECINQNKTVWELTGEKFDPNADY